MRDRGFPSKYACIFSTVSDQNTLIQIISGTENKFPKGSYLVAGVPELLSDTVRRNLDPFDQYDDAVLYDALRSAGLYSIQSEDEDARVGLDTAVASGGGNLSVGQRQILALARAMSSLRNELKGDVTLITVAHRLQTIMDADKIMVLDAGRIVEYDSPKELLKKEEGHLRALVDESADREHLRRMAEGIEGPVS
ncbi:hypothetical protein BT96DRAFT_988645 [Gymnopus androsaceus JB14]|uniref:P-loop containing nucleoside triphosphate hydrolase protein n=1 Tax=Gymnopus androsaceus JB14 TaxID=1447944 RepID=A0A6A4I3Q8_9AGAR|nr:hypothetical protein BT96DRAFT_988645 [Gymnopus androsaceus JB14]